MTTPTAEEVAEASKLVAEVLKASGYWLEASPEHVGKTAASLVAQALAESREAAVENYQRRREPVGT